MEQPRTNTPEFTVTELAQAVKRTVEDEFQYVRVRGEISGFRGQHSSGHAYFTLKDDQASIDAVVWKTTWPKLRFKPEEGLEIIATGRLTTFPRSSKYQIVIEQIEPAGAGALMALLEERRKKLLAEGLFAAERKKKLPYLPRVIGVVTSPTGAVIRDILHRLDDRFPTHVIVWPVRVQSPTPSRASTRCRPAGRSRAQTLSSSPAAAAPSRTCGVSTRRSSSAPWPAAVFR
jgi:exodeoxyribonuclease VII large subunit